MFDTRGFDRNGFHKNGTYFDNEGFNKFGFNSQGIHENGTKYNKHGFDINGIHKNGTNFDKNNFDKKSNHKLTGTRFDENRYDRDGFDNVGLDKRGYDKFGYDIEGFNSFGFDKDGFYRDGFDKNGLNRDGFDKNENAVNGTKYNDLGYNQNGFDRRGYNKDGFDRRGYNKDGFDKDGYNDRGYNLNGFNHEGFTRTGSIFNQDGFDAKGYNQSGFNHGGFDMSGFNQDGFDQFGFNKNGYNKDGYNKLGYDMSGFNKSGFNTQGQNRDDILFEIYSPVFKAYLDHKKWEEADKYLEDNKINPYSGRWIDLRIEIIKGYMSRYKNIYGDGINVSDEQLRFLIDLSPQILLQARAGSGKTTTLIYKTHFLLNELQYKKNEIIFLAFNKSAVNDVNEKFTKNGIDRFQNAMTFHSLAGRIGSNEDQVAEDKDFQMNRLIGEVIRKVLEDESMRNLLYDIFRKETENGDISSEYDEFISSKGTTSSEYYELVRDNQTYQTLDGKIVKSKAEKWLADFFFEHDIRYSYERTVQYEKKKENIRGYSPDFCLEGFKVQKGYENKIQNGKVWVEFWGINENDPRKQVKPDWDTTWEQYKEEMDWKRGFWSEQSEHTLIEFSISDIPYIQENAREYFEERIKSKLEGCGIICSKLPYEVLNKKVIELHKTKIEEMVEQFINRSKQRKWSPDDIEDRINSLDLSPNSRVGMFYIFSNHCYEQYTEILRDKGKKDYNDILIEATKKVHQEVGNINITISKKYNLKANLLELRYIMIDEYQDFSQLYFDLINAIQKFNKNLKIVCVGDDWQLINSFAGSQKCFYDKYGESEYFPGGKKLSLVKTWRCPQEIVNLSNSLMRGLGDDTKCGKGHNGIVSGKYIGDIFIECRKDSDKEYKKDSIYYIDNFGKVDKSRDKKNEERARYLKYCCDIIFIHKKENKKCTFLIMSRVNSTPFKKEQLIEAYFQKLKQEYPNFDWENGNLNQRRKEIEESITLQTVHKSKGNEADVCILLQVGESKGKSNAKFPFLHPDYHFGIIFGDTTKSIFEEERRLYYVALTRTKQDLYVISESEITNSKGISDFIISSFNEGYTTRYSSI